MRQLKDLGLIIAYELHGFRFVVNSRLYMLKVDGNYDQQDYKINLYEFNDGLHMIAEDVYEDLISIGY